MKSKMLTTLSVFALSLAVGPQLLAAGDEIEDLFGAPSAATADDSPVTLFDGELTAEPDATAHLADDDSSKYALPGQFPAAAESAPQVRGVTATEPEHAANGSPAPAAPINVVPEPSAVILALAALVYFLVFGRRRRVV